MTKTEKQWAVFIASFQCVLIAIVFFLIKSLQSSENEILTGIIFWLTVSLTGFFASMWELAGAPRGSTLVATILIPVFIVLTGVSFIKIRWPGLDWAYIVMFVPGVAIFSILLALGWLAGVFVIKESKTGWKLKW